jgi:hypothetical protein
MTDEDAAALETLCRRDTPADRDDIAKFLVAWLERREAERAT